MDRKNLVWVRLSPQEKKALKYIAEKKEVTMSDLIRKGIKEILEDKENRKIIDEFEEIEQALVDFEEK